MKKLIIVGMLMSSTGAFANDDLIAQCEAALEAEERDASGCACLVEQVGDDPALLAEFVELGQIKDEDARYEAASDEAKAAMDACTR
ncbi:MAG: hypothetical protein AAF720_08450 [Pseudomonadota bacterium]